MARARSSFPFLTLFFVALAVVVAVAIAMRVRTFISSADATARREATTSSPASPAPRVQNDPGVITETTAGETTTAAAATPGLQTLAEKEAERKKSFQRLLADKAIAVAQALNPSLSTPPPPAAAPAPQKPVPSRNEAMRQTQVLPMPQVATQPPRPGTSTPPANTPQVEDDPDSDTVPPQLLGIQFDPPQVQDGSSTVLTITASDNMTGVRTISGTIASPSKGVQGFALQREADTTRFSTRINIPQDAPEGTWAINYVNLVDNASNATSVTYVAPNVPQAATFRVTSSRPDSAGPTLKAVWLDRPSIKAGEKNTIFVQVDDDKSGVQTVSGVFVSPSKLARVGFSCQQAEGMNWNCTFSAPVCLDCGNWQLEQVQMQDKARNMSSVRSDNPVVAAVRMDIFGTDCDSRAPVMTSMTLDRSVISNAQASALTLTVQAADDLCGVSSISGHATGPTRPGSVARVYFALTSSDGRTWTGPINIPKSAPKGQWTITWTQILDKGFNLKAYPQGDPLLQGGAFRVE